VLVVEDDPAVRLLVLEVLSELGYAGLEAVDSESALQILASRDRIDLLISDVGLPNGLNGRQLAEVAREQRPNLPVLFVTGYAERATERREFLGPGMQMITKPFAMEALAAKVKEIIAGVPA
jgi:CheY-like chemotaxis protein